MRVLIVEDHSELARWLQNELNHVGWQCDVAATVDRAYTMVHHSFYDIILLDIMLPDGDGIALCRQLRHITSAAMIMITARDDLHDRVHALDDGADDYVTKPYAVEELLARIRAILRRTHGDPGPVLEFNDLRLWPEERTVAQNGVFLSLSRREFDLLLVFMQNPNRVLSRDQLLEKAWGYDFYGESNVVDVTVRRLRDHLSPEGHVMITTVRGVGYMLRGTHD
ncbi:response regulator transcription factor [Sulfobacillus thermosulfidooxidans]|uniref:response regulator transcription factor n=1 Tax=Sulfobacillus thermosulfidooxidans TaxID=28034 RepID=UPI000ABED8DA|nr:response regulator transcription factor [Sulfobacillus thermosulfidooxidans]